MKFDELLNDWKADHMKCIYRRVNHYFCDEYGCYHENEATGDQEDEHENKKDTEEKINRKLAVE